MATDSKQSSLFPPEESETIELAEDCRARLLRVLSQEQAGWWMDGLLRETDLVERSIVLFGKKVLQPRLVGWAGELPYTYSGQTLEPRPMGPRMQELLALTQKRSGYQFNHALVNLYRDGRDSMGMHSDDEPELGPAPVVASWSFGAARSFRFAEKRGSGRHRLTLPSGSLLLMEGDTQGRFRHGLPKERATTAPRLNVTFRLVRSGR